MTVKTKMAFKEAAKEIITGSEKALSAAEITEIALTQGLIETEGKTPWLTMSSHMNEDIKKLGDKSFFIKPEPGRFAARNNNFKYASNNTPKLMMGKTEREHIKTKNGTQVIYVAENPGIPEYIKIGMCANKKNLARRMKDLSNTSVPFPFELLYGFLVNDAYKVERVIKKSFKGHLAAEKREFYEKSALEGIIYPILELAGVEFDVNEINNRMLGLDTEKQLLEEGKKASEKRMRFNFQMVGIDSGAELILRKDSTITCKVISKFDVEYKGQKMSLSAAALEALKECGYNWTSARGSDQWIYDGETLTERRHRIELG